MSECVYLFINVCLVQGKRLSGRNGYEFSDESGVLNFGDI